MNCPHPERPSMYGDAHECAECYAESYKRRMGIFPANGGKGQTFEYCGPRISRSDGTRYREQRLK